MGNPNTEHYTPNGIVGNDYSSKSQILKSSVKALLVISKFGSYAQEALTYKTPGTLWNQKSVFVSCNEDLKPQAHSLEFNSWTATHLAICA